MLVMRRSLLTSWSERLSITPMKGRQALKTSISFITCQQDDEAAVRWAELLKWGRRSTYAVRRSSEWDRKRWGVRNWMRSRVERGCVFGMAIPTNWSPRWMRLGAVFGGFLQQDKAEGFCCCKMSIMHFEVCRLFLGDLFQYCWDPCSRFWRFLGLFLSQQCLTLAWNESQVRLQVS